jgi:Family of unknown function (DUF6272)
MSSATGKKLAVPRDIYRNQVRRCVDSNASTHIILSHYGGFCANTTDGLIKVFENTLLGSGKKRSFVKRFCSLFIEVAQNMCIHGSRDNEGLYQAFMIVISEEEYFRVISGNLILTQDIDRLNNKFAEIENLNKDDLHRLYIETLSNDEFSTKGGAGLGLLTIARKSEGSFTHHIEQLNSQFSYLTLEITVK